MGTSFRQRREQGQTLTEFALVLPLLALLLFAVVQFGVVFKQYLTLTDAVREGARVAAVSRHVGDGGASARDRVYQSASGLDPAKLGVSVVPSPGW